MKSYAAEKGANINEKLMLYLMELPVSGKQYVYRDL
jgi:hypothetical protein